MKEKMKEIPAKLLEIWQNYSKKQRMALISITATIILAIILLVIILNHTTYKELIACEDSKNASEVISILDGQGIEHKSSENGLTISVPEESYTDAIYALGDSDVTTVGMTWTEALSNDMTTTESEKSTKQKLALQSDLRKTLMELEHVKDAVVYLDPPKDDGTIFSENKETSVSAMLTLSESITPDAAKGIAKMLAGAVGNATTDNVTVLDSESNLLFDGSSDSTLGGSLASADEYRSKLRNQIGENIKAVLLKYGYDDAEVGTANIKLDMNKTTEMYTEYTPADGSEQGVYGSSYNYKSIGSSGSGGIPGAESNDDDTDYLLSTGGNSESETTLDKYEYKPNERITNTEYEFGAVVPEESSLGIVVTDFVVYNEDELKEQGVLDELTWEEFIAQNDTRTQVEVAEDLYTLVSNTTGISTDKISILAFSQPVFNSSTDRGFFGSVQNWLIIIIAILIIALLIFVIFRATAPVDAVEEEPELSVEQLLATTKEDQSLEDITFSEGSETRKLIEKFVDENPEAVAQLLRNWLNEDWE